MIELLLASRCTGCNACVEVCPTDVFDAVPGQAPVIARRQDCQTCFMCELYCRADALFVAPDCDAPAPVDPETVLSHGLLGQFRRESGWDEWSGLYPNEHWRMDVVFRRARQMAVTREPEPGPAPGATEGAGALARCGGRNRGSEKRS